MSELARMFIGVILLASPVIQYSSYFLGKLCCACGGTCPTMNDTQKGMLRAGRAHSGALIAISLFAEHLIDFATLPVGLDHILRYTFPISAVLISFGYYFAAKHKGTAKPSKLCGLLCLGAVVICFSFVVLGIGLVNHA